MTKTAQASTPSTSTSKKAGPKAEARQAVPQSSSSPQPYEHHDSLSDQCHARGIRRVTVGNLVLLGRAICGVSFAGSPNERESLQRVEQQVLPAFALRPDRHGIPEMLDEQDRSDLADAFWVGKWCASGFPRVRLRTARAALLAATAVPGDMVQEVRPPWPAFLIQLEGEEQLLADPERPGVYYDQIQVMYSEATGRPTWSFFRYSPTCVNYSRIWTAPEQWGSDLDSLRLFDGEELDPQSRIFQVVSRIVLGLCLHLTIPGMLDQARHRAKSKRFKNDRSGPPQMTNFVIGEDVKVDVRDAIRSYIRSGGSSPTVQSLVRGHWKRQAHGPNHSLRKLIHVEPYWRGPEDGPVVLRAHQV